MAKMDKYTFASGFFNFSPLVKDQWGTHEHPDGDMARIRSHGL